MRLTRLALVPLVIAAGLLARRFLPPLAAKISGDALYTVLMYVMFLVVRPRTSPGRAALVAIGFSFAIELFQLTWIPAWLSSQHVVLRLIFGTTFGFLDLASYLAGGALAFSVDRILRARAKAGPGGLPGDTPPG